MAEGSGEQCVTLRKQNFFAASARRDRSDRKARIEGSQGGNDATQERAKFLLYRLIVAAVPFIGDMQTV
jgi:hypothetical protein